VTLLYSQRGALIGATKVSGQTTLGEWYGHDASGRRISRTVSSTTNAVTTFPDEEYFAWTGGNVTGRVDKTGAVTQSFLFEGVDRPLRLRAGLLRY
jgi:YD repeat-containing protein